MQWTRSLAASCVLALTLGAASCGTTDTIEIPYSTLKQHIAKGDVREVRMSATELRALPTESARQAGAPEMWVATPVPNDDIVPLLESKNITYQGIKVRRIARVAHSRHRRGAYVRHHPRHVVQAHEPREVDDGADARPAPGRQEGAPAHQFRFRGWRGRGEGRARRDREVSAQPVEVFVAGRARAKGCAARRASGHRQNAPGACGRRRSRRAVLLRERLGVHRGLCRRWRVARAEAVRAGQVEGAGDHLHRRARCHRQEPFRWKRRRRNRRARADAESAARRDGRVRLARRHRRDRRNQPARDPG